MKKWYVLHTYSGYEEKVKSALLERLKSAGLKDYVEDILIPQEEETERKRGRSHPSSRHFFPGYILIRMELNEDVWHIIKHTPRLSGFVGGNLNPPSIPDEDVERLNKEITEGTISLSKGVWLERGDNIRVIDGPFNTFNGVVEEVFPEKNKIKVLLSIFGRPTPVELDFSQIEKS